MKKISLLIILFLTTIIHSQNIEFKVGTEYRITPIRKISNLAEPITGAYFSQDDQLTGTAFNYSIGYLTKSGFGFGFSHSFKYSHIYYERTDNNTEKSVNDLITDYKLFIKQEFEIKKNLFFIEVGGSLMNNGTTYHDKEEIDVVFSDESVIFISTRDFSYRAMNIEIGYIYKKFEIGLGMYFTSGYLLADNPKEFKLPYFSMNYRIY